jgi:hypothetical protein
MDNVNVVVRVIKKYKCILVFLKRHFKFCKLWYSVLGNCDLFAVNKF